MTHDLSPSLRLGMDALPRCRHVRRWNPKVLGHGRENSLLALQLLPRHQRVRRCDPIAHEQVSVLARLPCRSPADDKLAVVDADLADAADGHGRKGILRVHRVRSLGHPRVDKVDGLGPDALVLKVHVVTPTRLRVLAGCAHLEVIDAALAPCLRSVRCASQPKLPTKNAPRRTSRLRASDRQCQRFDDGILGQPDVDEVP